MSALQMCRTEELDATFMNVSSTNQNATTLHLFVSVQSANAKAKSALASTSTAIHWSAKPPKHAHQNNGESLLIHNDTTSAEL
jgi:hypothetical protein|nr:hypothetical protein [uncultured Limnohabitans sp.]